MPALAGSPDACVDELVAFLDRHPTGVVLPAYDGSIDAIRARRRDRKSLRARSRFGKCPRDRGHKERTLGLARYLGITTPRSADLRCLGDVEAAVSEIGLPAVLKPRRSWVTSSAGHLANQKAPRPRVKSA